MKDLTQLVTELLMAGITPVEIESCVQQVFSSTAHQENSKQGGTQE